NRAELEQWDGFFVEGNLAVIVEVQVDNVGFGGGPGQGGGGQTRLQSADLLHVEADHHEGGEEKEHDVDQGDDLDARAFPGEGGANLHGARGFFGAESPLTVKATFWTPAWR